jgi:hypothetical protein
MADQHHLNGQPHPSPKEIEAHFKAAAAQIWVAQTALGPPIKDVKQSTFAAGHLYSMYFHNSASVNLHNLIFKVTFKAGSPLYDQVQTFLFPGGYSGSVTTPFGVHRPMSTRELKRGQALHRSLQSIMGKRETRPVGPPICEGWLFAPR